MSILALDWGEKKIGVAVLPAEVKVPLPLGVVENSAEILEKIQPWITQYQVKKIVVGLPLGLNGAEGEQASRVKEQSKILDALNVPVEFVDERLSSKTGSVSAEIAGQAQDDAYAAAQLLEKFL